MTFTAKYGGRCGVCDERIHEGDLCAYSADVVVHADCPEPSREPEQRPVCNSCFMETSVNGACGCDQ